MFYGTRGEVSTRTAKLQKELVRGKPLMELDFGPMMSTAEDPKARIVLRWGRSYSDSPHFHPYYFFEKVTTACASGRLNGARREECFACDCVCDCVVETMIGKPVY